MAYVNTMAEPRAKLGTAGKIALVAVPLVVMLAAAAWYAAQAWTALSGPPMPATGYVAMTIGIIFSLVVGCGLMALLFYSNRHGYDEPHRAEDDHAG
jgi:heme/copper-type cytochrome/quinol oxidase subunit 2